MLSITLFVLFYLLERNKTILGVRVEGFLSKFDSKFPISWTRMKKKKLESCNATCVATLTIPGSVC